MDVKPQVVEIVMRGGTVFQQRVVYPKGNPKNPVTSDELVAAFRVMASYAAQPLSAAKIDETVSLTLHLEKAPTVNMFGSLLSA